jgi:hypothetical protein
LGNTLDRFHDIKNQLNDPYREFRRPCHVTLYRKLFREIYVFIWFSILLWLMQILCLLPMKMGGIFKNQVECYLNVGKDTECIQ